MNNSSDSQLKISKSTRSPSIDLSYAIKVVEEARKFGRKIANAHIAGDSSTVSGAFKQKKASLGYYGLISGRGDEYEVTDLAEAIINPMSDEERLGAIKRAFLSPEIFNSIYSSLEKGKPIRLDILGNLVVREYGIQPTAKNDFLNTFVKAGKYAQLIEFGGDKSEIVALPIENPESESVADNIQNTSILSPQAAEIISEDTQAVELILSTGKARIIVPKNLSENDAKKLKKQIDILADILD